MGQTWWAKTSRVLFWNLWVVESSASPPQIRTDAYQLSTNKLKFLHSPLGYVIFNLYYLKKNRQKFCHSNQSRSHWNNFSSKDKIPTYWRLKNLLISKKQATRPKMKILKKRLVINHQMVHLNYSKQPQQGWGENCWREVQKRLWSWQMSLIR